MNRTPGVFLSYSRKDLLQALLVEAALRKRGLSVFRDASSIPGGTQWFNEIETNVRKSRAVVVLLSKASRASLWVTYEYALARGATTPVVAVVLDSGVKVPSPLTHLQVVRYSDPPDVAKTLDDSIRAQSRFLSRQRSSTPVLMAKFREINGRIQLASSGRRKSFWIDLWVDGAPSSTKRVAFEILDEGFRDRKWTVRRPMRARVPVRPFLTPDMNSYGDVDISARGLGVEAGRWSTTSSLHEALLRFYRGRPISANVRRALRQIETL